MTSRTSYKSIAHTIQMVFPLAKYNAVLLLIRRNIDNKSSYLCFTEKDIGVFRAFSNISDGVFCVIKSFMLHVWQYSEYTFKGNENHYYFQIYSIKSAWVSSKNLILKIFLKILLRCENWFVVKPVSVYMYDRFFKSKKNQKHIYIWITDNCQTGKGVKTSLLN